MKITEEEVRYVADLANLKLTEAEIHKFQADLDEILAHMDKLNEIDTSSVPPMAQVLYRSYDGAAAVTSPETATLREDCERPPLGNDRALANAPLAGAGYFKVPKVIER